MISLTTNVVQKNVVRIGLNLEDAWWGANTLKVRTAYNFEGKMYRYIYQWGVLYTNGFAAEIWSTNDFYKYGSAGLITNGATFNILNGEARTTTGSFSRIYVPAWLPEDKELFFEFTDPITLSQVEENAAIMCTDISRLDEGYIGATNNNWWLGKGDCILITNDSPGNFGTVSMEMKAGGEPFRLPVYKNRLGNVNGDWIIKFYARNSDNAPTLNIISAHSASQNISLSGAWKEYMITQTVSGVTNTEWEAGFEDFQLRASGSGKLRLDDIQLWKAGQTKSKSFSDDFMDAMEILKPGIVRSLYTVGMVSNKFSDPIRQYSAGGFWGVGAYEGTGSTMEKKTITPHQICELALEIGADPWINLPSTVTHDEMEWTMEYLSGDETTEGGKFRIALGQTTPWTEVFDIIQLEYGNEAWNAGGGYNGYNGPDYWHDLIAVGKSSPYYRTNVLFTLGGWAVGTYVTEGIINNAPNGDSVCIAPYMVGPGTTSSEISYVSDSNETLFNWFLARVMNQIYDNDLYNQKGVMERTGMEQSLYEYNYHTTGNVVHEPINRFFGSVCHGLNAGNSMLAMLKEYGIRRQCYFTQSGDYFGVELWGCTHTMKKGYERYKPDFLAMAAINNIIGGDMVETAQSGDNPEFTSIGYFYPHNYETNIYPVIYSYAFKNGETNGLAVFNYDLFQTQDVEIILPVYVKNNPATCWKLNSEAFTSDNDPENSQLTPLGVTLSEETVSDFSSGFELSIPAHSMQVYKWISDGVFPNLTVSTNTLIIPENGSNSFKVFLTDSPRTAFTVTVTRVSGDTNMYVHSGSPAILDTANWDTGVEIFLAADDDPDTEFGRATFRCSSPGLSDSYVIAIELENDFGIIATPTSISIPENGSEIFDVRLSTNPGGAYTVTVTRISGDANIAPSPDPTVLNFNTSNWSLYQTVTVNAGDDPDISNNQAILSCAGVGADTNYVICTEIDDDTVELVVSPRSIEIYEGGTNSFGVKLSAIPLENSTVSVSRIYGSTNLFLTSGETIVFGTANWNVEQYVTIAAREDSDYIRNKAVFRCEPMFSNTEGPVDVSAKSIDNDVTNVNFQVGVSPAGYSKNEMTDTCLDSWQPTVCFGDDVYVPLVSGNIRKALVRWDLTSMPTTAKVVSADLTLTIYNNNISDFQGSLYELKRNWVEGTTDGTGADWNTYDGSTPWQTAGAEGANDVGDTNLGSAVFNTLTVTIELNKDGLKCVENWIKNPGDNHGFLLAEGGPTWPLEKSDIKTSETSIPSERPKLSIGYNFLENSAPTNASVIINNGELTTTWFTVALALFAENPTPFDMQISEDPDFSNAGWIAYRPNFFWTFRGDYGEKTIYARFSDGGAGISEIASNSIQVIPEPIGCTILSFVFCIKLFRKV